MGNDWHANMDRTDVIRSRVAALEAELAEREKFGTDFFEEGEVLVFSGDYGNAAGEKYRFAALKAGGKWWVTGRAYDGSALTWDGLVDFLIRVNARKVRVVTETRRIA